MGYIFDARCEDKGLHYHSLIITNIKDTTQLKQTDHCAHGDGTVSKPNYEFFVASKIKYFETTYAALPITIHDRIRSFKTFDDDAHDNVGTKSRHQVLIL